MPTRYTSTCIAVATVLLALPFFAGCDTSSPDPVFADTGVRSLTFTPRIADFEINPQGDVATYVRQTNRLTTAIVDQGVVLLYARGDLIVIGGEGSWTALPYTQGIEGDGFTDFTITYSYSFEPGHLYLDVITSAPGLFNDNFYVQRYVPNNIPFRLVTIPPGTALVPGVDYSNYNDVARAYNLAD